jgi:hypothetical protein
MCTLMFPFQVQVVNTKDSELDGSKQSLNWMGKTIEGQSVWALN